MTPAARVSAAIEILDDIVGGAPAERTLTGWARRSRFAGSGDRAAVRDLVFDALRCWRSYGWLGGGETGRSIVLGGLRAQGQDPDAFFTGDRHAPSPLSDAELAPTKPLEEAPRGVRLDVQDWLLPRLDESLGGSSDDVLLTLRQRASIMLRANPRKRSRDQIIADLASDGIASKPHPLAPHAIEIVGETRKLAQHDGYLAGHFEFQDAASQAAIQEIAPLLKGADVLDYCAGGGGKSLAMAASGARTVTAYDAAPQRMNDLPARAARAGERIELVDAPRGQFDLVLCDVPCSGSGAWRRQPEAKWRLTEGGLDHLLRVQSEIIDAARQHVAPGGYLVYMTCSLLTEENERQVKTATDGSDKFRLLGDRRLSPLDGCDGFYVAKILHATDNN